MKFVKMHVAGNDLILLDTLSNSIPENYTDLAKQLCHRHFGVSADGIVLILKSDKADLKVSMINPDGSEPWVSANGVICASRYAIDTKLIEKSDFSVETKAKIVKVKVAEQITLDLGAPLLEAKQIPALFKKQKVVNEQLKLKDRIVRATCLSMGNPHCVIFVDDVDTYDVREEGRIIENHEEFPRRINVEFVQLINDKELKVRMWERGVGETMSFGTGACAAVVAGVLTKKTINKVDVHMPGGTVTVEYEDHVLMTLTRMMFVKREEL